MAYHHKNTPPKHILEQINRAETEHEPDHEYDFYFCMDEYRMKSQSLLHVQFYFNGQPYTSAVPKGGISKGNFLGTGTKANVSRTGKPVKIQSHPIRRSNFIVIE